MADEPKQRKGPTEYAQAESILQMALSIPAGAFLGLGIGYLLDRHFHTNWMTIALLFLGAAGGFVNLFGYLSRHSGSGNSGPPDSGGKNQ